MPTEQLLLRLPDTVVRRFRRHVPARLRSDFVRKLLEEALPRLEGDNDPLYLAALAVEEDERLAAEMAEWEQATVADGLPRQPPNKRKR
jgi:hypothetical protein